MLMKVYKIIKNNNKIYFLLFIFIYTSIIIISKFLLYIYKACSEWGIACLRYEILNIEPPQEIKLSM